MKLNPVHLSVAELLQGRLFRIPDYQRAYSWQKRQREDLFADIREVHRSQRGHFMATLVALARERRVIDADEFNVVELVDGQQRITTLVILLKAIEKALIAGDKKEAKIKSDLQTLLIKGDEHNLVLLQTNHDSSDVFAEYIHTGTIKRKAVITASDKNLVYAADDCERFVAEWREAGILLDLVFSIRNRLSMIYHEIGEESTVYRVFEVLNSRGLDVKWLDKTKSQLMATIYEYVPEGSRKDGLHEMQTIWKDVYRELGLDDQLGDEALRFAGTWSRKTRPNRILSDEDASIEIVRSAGDKLKTIVAAAGWLKTVVLKVIELNGDRRRSAVTRIAHARFLAIAIMLRDFDSATEQTLLGAWERVTFRIFTLAGKDSRTKIGDYVRLGYDILANNLSSKAITASLLKLGDGYSMNEIISKDSWENWYEGWLDEVRYVLFRYEEHVAREEGVQINQSEWAKVWAVDPARSVEHIKPQSSEKGYVHHLGNLTMLPPGVNSSLQDKPPEQKAVRYIESGLRATMKVGRDIEGGLRWNRKAVFDRAAKIEEFVRVEWAD
jgi:hypothetical protein